MIRVTRSRWALAAAALAGTAVLLAGCLESRLAFSPDGKHLAAVTAEALNEDGRGVAGSHSYKLIVFRDRKTPDVLAETAEAILSAPAWSPDGNRLAVVRIALPTEAELDAIQDRAAARGKKLAALRRDDGLYWSQVLTDPEAPLGDGNQPETRTKDQTLPNLSATALMFNHMLKVPPAEAYLEILDARTGKPLSRTRVHMPHLEAFTAYSRVRPQFAPDGREVYVSTGWSLVAVHPVLKRQKTLAAPIHQAYLRADGGQAAVIQDQTLCLLDLQTPRAVYLPCSICGDGAAAAWLDANTVAVAPKQPELAEGNVAEVDILLFTAEGRSAGKRTLELTGPTSGFGAELAAAGDGSRLALTYGPEMWLLDGDGKTVAHMAPPETFTLSSPVFAPDGKTLAVRRTAKLGENDFRTAEVLFYSIDGKPSGSLKMPAAGQ